MSVVDRRSFIQFVVGGVVGITFTPVTYKLTDDVSIWTQNWPWVPKIPKSNMVYAPVISKLCPSGSGVKIVLAEGRPCAVIGDPDHPLGKGAVSAAAQSEVGMLYSPSRVKQPMKKTIAGFVPVSWNEAERLLVEKTAAAEGDLAFISGDDTGSSNDVFSAFTGKVGGKYYMMPSEAQAAHKAWKLLGGQGRVGYDIENADYVLMLGADALESWGASVANARAFSETHPHGGEATAKFVYAGPVRNNTAVVSDEWVPAKPGAAAGLALGLARTLMQNGATSESINDFAGFKKNAAANYDAATVKRLTGVDEKTVNRIAGELAKAKRPLVIVGSEFSQGSGARALMAGLSLNLLLGRLNKTGGLRVMPEAPTVVDGALDADDRYTGDLVAFLRGVAKGNPAPKAAFVYDANPVYGLPESDVMAKAFAKIPFKVAFSSFMDETAAACDLVLPTPLTIERADDAYTPYGSGVAVYNVNKPVIEPVVDAKPAADVVLSLAETMGLGLGFGSYESVLNAKIAAVGAEPAGLKKGKAWVSRRTLPQSAMSVAAAALPGPAQAGKGALALAPVEKRNLGTSGAAVSPGSMRTIRDTDLSGDKLVVNVNAKTARENGLRGGDVVTLQGAEGSIEAMVNVNEGVMDGVVAASLGFGRTAWDAFSKDRGDNVFKALSVVDDAETGLSVWNAGMINVAKA